MGDRVAQLYPQALGNYFNRLLRHAWVKVGLFFIPGHHTGKVKTYKTTILLTNIVVEWLAFLLHVQEVSCLNLGQVTGYPD
jgi:hypothetical protein